MFRMANNGVHTKVEVIPVVTSLVMTETKSEPAEVRVIQNVIGEESMVFKTRSTTARMMIFCGFTGDKHSGPPGHPKPMKQCLPNSGAAGHPLHRKQWYIGLTNIVNFRNNMIGIFENKSLN